MRTTDTSPALECYDRTTFSMYIKNRNVGIDSSMLMLFDFSFSHCEPDRAAVVAVHVTGQAAEGVPLPRGLPPHPGARHQPPRRQDRPRFLQVRHQS